MNSTLKPVLPQPGPQPSGQSSPAKGNVAAVNHAAVAHPQAAQNSVHHPASPALVGQNLTHPAAAPPAPQPAHSVPSMAPVTHNMVQMAQNMSHHGNLSHITQNSNAAPAVSPPAVVPPLVNKVVAGAPLSLVQDKANGSQPLALTRPLEKTESDSSVVQANGNVESSKTVQNIPTSHKPLQQNAEPEKAKIEIARNVPSTPAAPESAAIISASLPPIITSQKSDVKHFVKGPPQHSPQPTKTTSEATTPSKLSDSKDPPSNSSPALASVVVEEAKVPEVVNKTIEKEPHVVKQDVKIVNEEIKDMKTVKEVTKETKPVKDDSKVPEVKIPSVSPAKPEIVQKKVIEKPDAPKLEETPEKVAKKEEPIEKKEVKDVDIKKPMPVVTAVEKKESALPVKEVLKKESPKVAEKPTVIPEPVKIPIPKKIEPKTPVAKSTLKLATVTPTARKRRQDTKSPAVVSSDGPSPAKKQPDVVSTPDSRLSKRNRTKVQPYQSPTPELTMATKLSASAGRSTPTKPGDDKLIVFYKNEYLAVRNAEGSFYVCQAVQNVYRNTRKIKIRWLSQDKSLDPSGETYKPDFYDVTDMECVLTTLSLVRSPKGGGAQLLKAAEEARAKSILDRALKVEQSGEKPQNLQLTEEHPDGLDLSLYTDESQLEKKKRSRKRNSSKSSLDRSEDLDSSDAGDENPLPAKRAKSPKKSPKSAQKVAKSSPKSPIANNKRKSPGSTPIMAAASKVGIVQRIYRNTATIPVKPSPVKTPAKVAKNAAVKKAIPVKQAKVETPLKSPRGKTPKKPETKTHQIVPTPSTSTGKTTRTPRKPPSKK